jgi:hypothetical protein
VIVPRTTGCNLRKPENIKVDKIPYLLNSSGDFHPLVELMIRDLFRRLDKITLDNSLDYGEIKEFCTRVNMKLTEEEYRKNILRKFSPDYARGLNKRAFLNMWKDAIKTQGENTVWKWLEKWGYDRELFAQEARSFMLSIHSLKPVAVSVSENGGFDSLINRMIIVKEGKEIEKRQGQYRLLQKFYE